MDFSNFKEFHCSICDKLFDGVERSPKMLSCGHSFCLSCLNKIFPHSPNCPTCKADIQFSSVELIPVNLLIQSCVSKINVKSGVKRKVITELKEAENHSSTEVDAKRKKMASVGFCKEHENFNQLRCMNCETWICSMCATLNHKKCDTLLIEDAFKEIQKQNTQIISNQRDIRKSKLAMVFKYLKAIEDKKKLLELDIENLKLQIEAKLKEINKQNIEFDKLQTIITDEKKICAKLNEIQLLTNSSLCIEKLLEAKKELDDLIQLSKNDQELSCYVAEKEEVSEKEDIQLVLNNKGSTVGNGGPIGGPGLPPGGGRNDGIMEVLFCVPANKCGIVIGKGGETIKQINKQTGANCSLDRRPDANPNPSEKTFILRGTPNQLENAKKLISEKAGIKYRRSGVGPGQGGNVGTGSRPGQNSPSNLAPQVGANSYQQFNQALHPIGPSPGQGGNGGTGTSGSKPGQNSPSNFALQVGANSYQQLNQALHPIDPSSLGIIESNSGLSTTFQISPNSLRSKLGMASLALKTHSKSLNSSMLLEENLSSTTHNKNKDHQAVAGNGVTNPISQLVVPGNVVTNPISQLEVPGNVVTNHPISQLVVPGKVVLKPISQLVVPDLTTSVSLGGARTGPILIIGDSRVGELMKYPKQVFESNVEFYWEERLQVAKMIKAVDEMRREDHSAIILVGLLADFTEIKMVTSSNGQLIEKLVCEAGEAEIMDVMEQVIEASRRWEREHIGQVIVWTIPYFVDFSRFNFLKIGEENVIEESKKYTSNLIKIFIILRDTWKNLLVGIPYSDLNDALFHHCSAKSKLWKTILSTQVMPEKHPFLMLTTNDGIHPTERLVNHMWTKFSKYVDLRSRYLEKLD